MSSACTAARLHEDGCPVKLICLPVKVNGVRAEYCLEPCDANGDASECLFYQSLNTCETIPEAPQIGYCK